MYVLKSKIIQFENEITSKTMESCTKEADLSSKSFEIQAIEAERNVYKQRLNDIASSKMQEKHQVMKQDFTAKNLEDTPTNSNEMKTELHSSRTEGEALPSV